MRTYPIRKSHARNRTVRDDDADMTNASRCLAVGDGCARAEIAAATSSDKANVRLNMDDRVVNRHERCYVPAAVQR